MSHSPVDPEEMAKRTDEDFNAVLHMIGEGSPVFESYPYGDDDVFERKKHHRAGEELPDTYQ